MNRLSLTDMAKIIIVAVASLMVYALTVLMGLGAGKAFASCMDSTWESRLAGSALLAVYPVLIVCVIDLARIAIELSNDKH